jgi:alpha-L-fucosidase 2
MRQQLITLLILFISVVAQSQNILWYKQPATIWNEALPIGNGRLGAMVFGGTNYERIQLNEETIWTGDRNSISDKEDAYKYLPEVRRLLFEGEYAKAQAITELNMMQPGNWNTYQTLGDMFVSVNHKGQITNYKRELNIDNAIAKVSYLAGDIEYTREYLSSHVDNVIAVRYSASKKGSIELSVKLTRPKDCVISVDGNTIIMSGQVTAGDAKSRGVNPGVRYETRLKLINDKGSMQVKGDSLVVKGANAVTLFLVAHSNYWGQDPHEQCTQSLGMAIQKSFDEIKSAHIVDYKNLFDRVTLDLGSCENEKLPTDERLKAFQNGAEDPALYSLYFQYGPMDSRHHGVPIIISI